MSEFKLYRAFVLSAAVLFLTSCMTETFPRIQKTPLPPIPETMDWSEAQAEEARISESADRAAEAALIGASSDLASQPKVTNTYIESDIRAVLIDMATQTGINIIPDNAVEGIVSVDLLDVPLETALQMVLYPAGLSYRKVGNYYLVGLAQPENASFKDLTRTKVIRTNVPAVKVVERLSSYFKPFTSVSADSANTITVTGPPDLLARIEADISEVDAPKRQIEISAVIADIQWERGRNIGTEWGDIALSGSGRISGGKDIPLAITGDVAGLLFNTVRTLDRKATVNIRANTTVVAMEGEQAELKLTQEHYFMIMSGGGALYYYYTSQKVDVGVILNVVPIITRDGAIHMTIRPEVSDVIGERQFKVADSTQTLPIINRRTETTTVSAGNGETITIGGLMMQTQKTVDKRLGIPIIGDILAEIPILNLLFRGTESLAKDSELVIFITPRIVRS